MTKENQFKLYKHFLNLAGDPKPKLAAGEVRVPGGVDKDFIVKQAKEQIKAILKVYPEFAQPEPKETKSKGKK